MTTKKFVPAAERIKHIQISTTKMQKHLRTNAKSISKANSSKGNPKLKILRVKKLKALQMYLQAAIMYNTGRMKEIKTPS